MENLAIINHNKNHYRVNFAFIIKKDAFNLIKNAKIIDKKRKHYKVKINNFLSVHNIKMSPKTIKFGDKEINRKEFYLSKQAIPLDAVNFPYMRLSTDRVSRLELYFTRY